MGRKQRDIEPRSIFPQHLYGKDKGRATEVRERSVAYQDQPQTSTATETAKVPSNLMTRIMRLYRQALQAVRRYNNVVSWSLASSFMIPTGGTGRVIIPFNQENVAGQGGRFTGGVWQFAPPAKYQGDYDLNAFLEFKAGSMQAITAARLEIWKVNKRSGVESLWKVIDVDYMEKGDTADDTWLVRVVLRGGCEVTVSCDEVVRVVLWTNTAQNFTPFFGSEIYGWVDMRFNGCMGDLKTPPEAYTII